MSNEESTSDNESPARDFDAEVERAVAALTPKTRRLIIWALGAIATMCIVAEVLITLFGHTGSDALMAVASAAVGGIAGLAVPQSNND